MEITELRRIISRIFKDKERILIMAGIFKLILLSDQLRGKSFELTKGRYSCGRFEKHDICIKDPTISLHHCDFIRDGNSYIVSDCGSTNGTRINNVPITEQKLWDSDIVQIGRIEILFDCNDIKVSQEFSGALPIKNG